MLEQMDETVDHAVIRVFNVCEKAQNIIDWLKNSDEGEGLAFIDDEFGLFNRNKENMAGLLALEHDDGREHAIEIREKIRENISGVDLLIILVNLDVPYESGFSSIVSELSKEMGVLTVAIGIKDILPDYYSDINQYEVVGKNIFEIREYVDTFLIISPSKNFEKSHLEIMPSLRENLIVKAIHGISELIYRLCFIRVDFADVRTIMSEKGMARMSYGIAHGDKKANNAVEQALFQIISNDTNLIVAKGLLVTIRSGFSISMEEYEIVDGAIKEYVLENTIVVTAIACCQNLIDEMQVIIVATGVES